MDDGGGDAAVDEDVANVVDRNEDAAPVGVGRGVEAVELDEERGDLRHDTPEYFAREHHPHPLHTQGLAAVDSLEQRVDHLHHRGVGSRIHVAHGEHGVDESRDTPGVLPRAGRASSARGAFTPALPHTDTHPLAVAPPATRRTRALGLGPIAAAARRRQLARLDVLEHGEHLADQRLLRLVVAPEELGVDGMEAGAGHLGRGWWGLYTGGLDLFCVKD